MPDDRSCVCREAWMRILDRKVALGYAYTISSRIAGVQST